MVNNPQLGVDMLHKCSLATPQVLVSKLREDSNKISLLEEVLSKGQACETKVIEILDTLYSFGEF